MRRITDELPAFLATLLMCFCVRAAGLASAEPVAESDAKADAARITR